MTDPGRFPGCTGCPFESWKIYTTPTTSQGNEILYNKISNYLKLLYDGGGHLLARSAGHLAGATAS